MSKSALSFLWFGLVVVCGCGGTAPGIRAQPMPDAAFRWHFVGLNQINAATNGTKLRQILALPETAKLQNELVRKCGGPLAEMLMLGPATEPTNSRAPAGVMQSLLPEFLRHESLIEVRTANDLVKEWIIAVHLPPAAESREASTEILDWEKEYRRILAHAGTDLPSKLTYQSAFTGWQAGRKDRSGLYTYMRVGQWSVFNFQRDGRPWLAVMAQLKATGRPLPAASDYLLALDADLPALRKWWPLPDYVDFPKVALTVAAQGDSLRSVARLRFPDTLAWNWQPWQLPTQSLQDPLLSFTAVQGLEPWLRRHPVMQKLAVPFPLRQFFVWAHNDIPFKTFAALPVPDATNQIRQFAPRLATVMNTNTIPAMVGAVRVATNGLEAVWLGLPIFAPFLRPAGEPGDNFLLAGTMAGLVPTMPNTNPPPPELLARLTARTNLFYYDWEITEGRLAQWRQMNALLAMLGTAPALPTPTATLAQPWLDAITPHLGNTITEVTLEQPHELQLIRKSHLGLTGFELVQLAKWFGSENFPSLLPPPPPPAPGAPVPAVPPGRLRLPAVPAPAAPPAPPASPAAPKTPPPPR